MTHARRARSRIWCTAMVLRRLALPGLWLLTICAGGSGCNQSSFEDIRGEMADDGGDPDGGGTSPTGPGGTARDEVDVACVEEDDCGPGETCADGVCQELCETHFHPPRACLLCWGRASGN